MLHQRWEGLMAHSLLSDDWAAVVTATPAACLTILAVVFLLFANRLWRYRLERGIDDVGGEADGLPLPPGDLGYMLIGETPKLAWQGYDFFRKRREKYGRIYKTHLFGQPTVRVYGSENLAAILRSEELLVTMRWPKSVKMVLGDKAVSHLSRREHNLRRAHLLRVFNHNIVPGCIEQVQMTVRACLESWCHSGRIMGCTESRRLALKVMMEAVMGVPMDERLSSELYKAMCVVEQGVFSLPYHLPGTGISKAVRARQLITRHIKIGKASEQDNADGDSSNAFFRTLRQMGDGRILTNRELEDECMSMILTSFQGLSSVTCTLLVQLARNSEIVCRARQELDEAGLLQRELCGSTDVALTYDALKKLPFINDIVKEALRVIPPVGGGYRKVLKTFALEGYRIPKGWTLLYSIRDQHEAGDTGIDDPCRFDPARWSDERQLGAATNKYAYMPFGGDGQRSCVGARFVYAVLMVIVVELVSNFRWSLHDDRPPKMRHFPVPYPQDGLPITFERS